METSETKSINIPFAGLYESIHSEVIDHELQSMLCENRGLNDYFYTNVDCNWGDIHNDYAENYCEDFAIAFDLDLKFEELVSPREYNFQTDRIFAQISEANIIMMFGAVDYTDLRDMVKERFTSCDGFISHYSPKLHMWDSNPLNWDANQLGTLLIVYIAQEDRVDPWEYSIIADPEMTASNLLSQHIPELGRLSDIASYLEDRSCRPIPATNL